MLLCEPMAHVDSRGSNRESTLRQAQGDCHGELVEPWIPIFTNSRRLKHGYDGISHFAGTYLLITV